MFYSIHAYHYHLLEVAISSKKVAPSHFLYHLPQQASHLTGLDLVQYFPHLSVRTQLFDPVDFYQIGSCLLLRLKLSKEGIFPIVVYNLPIWGLLTWR
jgi:hypothetical protein